MFKMSCIQDIYLQCLTIEISKCKGFRILYNTDCKEVPYI